LASGRADAVYTRVIIEYKNPSSAAARNELARLAREYRTLPPRHSCSCRGSHCRECLRLNQLRGCLRHVNGYMPGCWACNEHQEPHPDIGRTQPVNAPMPSALMLDLERALTVLGRDSEAHAIARYMSFNGTSAAAGLRKPAVTVEHELLCLMCSRPAAAGQLQCRHCGGCLVVVTVA